MNNRLLAIALAPLLFFAPAASRAADETEDAPPIKTAIPNKGKLQATELVPFGTIGSPVGIAVDDTGRVFITESNRRTNGELDIRKHYELLLGTLADRTVEDKRKLIRAHYHKGAAGDQNKDGMQDWRDLTIPAERINLLIDENKDGKFEKKTVFAEGFNDEITGVAGGVLSFNGDIYTTIQPDLWKLTAGADPNKAEKRISLSHGHGVHIGYGGHDMHGLAVGPDGRIYWSQGDKGYSLTTKDGKTLAHQYEGAVFRVDPDGANLEVFAYGLRNPQELAFDDYGNLFSVDNDADLGDRERFVYIAQGSDSGWRATYQYRNRKIPNEAPGGYNPWMAEELWKPRFDTQASYLTPPISNYSDGPCGFKYNPGTALNDEWKGHFFLTQFPKKLMTAFRAEPDGAGFKMVGDKIAFSGLMMTGIAFGPDGAIYAADWGENAWAPHQKGRAVRIDVPGSSNQSGPRVETQRMLAEGFSKRPADELTSLLSNPDQRIRLHAQFALAAMGSKGVAPLIMTAQRNENPLARVHAIWGLGQMLRRGHAPSPLVAQTLITLLTDNEVEVRSQSAKVLADARHAPAIEPLANLLKDPSPRAKYFAAHALGQLASEKTTIKAHLPAIVALLEANKNKDVYLRHAGIMALVGIGQSDAGSIADLAAHADRSVRLAAIVALRRLSSPLVSKFLADKDEWVIAEAARAIHDDTSIPAALPALAELLPRAISAPGVKAAPAATGPLIFTNDALLRRSINANVRVGDAAAAQRLATFAASGASSNLRAFAIDALAWFAHTSKLDLVEGRHRDLGKRDEKLAHAALDPVLNRLLNDSAPAVRNSTVSAIQQLNFDAAKDRLAAIALDANQPAAVRGPAIAAIFALKSPKTREAVDKALATDDPRLRATARTVLAQMNPNDAKTMTALKGALTSDSVIEQQGALYALGLLKSKESSALLNEWLDKLLAKSVPAPLQLDVIEAAQAHAVLAKDKAIPAKLKKYQSAKPMNNPSATYSESLEGGSAHEGELVFNSGQCTQCHAVNGQGGNVGPDLRQIATRLSRLQLLQSIVDPGAQIAESFASISVTNKEGDTITGTIQSESATELVLKDEEGQIQKIKIADIDSRTKPGSAMPPMAEVMKPREIRDVVEYLMTLK